MSWPSYPYQMYGRNYYMGRLIGEVMPYHGAHHLMGMGRDMQAFPDLMLTALGIRPGMVVADIGAGLGFNSFRLARLVGPSGLVFSTDIQPLMLDHLAAKAYLLGLNQNIVPVLASHMDPNLPRNSFDLILMVDCYHECTHPPALLHNLRRALKPHGRLVIVEYRLENSWIPYYDDHRMSIVQTQFELASNGFHFLQAHEFLPWQHILIFGKV